MATLSVRNVGPIDKADIEIKKHTVFIGPQGSGKSTLAKLIAIGCEDDILPTASPYYNHRQGLVNKYELDFFLRENTSFQFQDENYRVEQQQSWIKFDLTQNGENLNQQELTRANNKQISSFQKFNELFIRRAEKKPSSDLSFKEQQELEAVNEVFYSNFLPQFILRKPSLYVPTERNLFSILSDAIWSLVYGDVNIPRSIKLFGQYFEYSRNTQIQIQLHIPFLKIRYSRENGRDLVYYDTDKAVPLTQSASGYQAIIPLLVVVEAQRRQAKRRFIIEEPELNLYPTTQKELIYSLISGLDPTATYQDAEWVFTTHSPYILSSLNTLLLAWKVAHTSDELRAKVEQIIPARCWINPDEFAAYYVNKGTVESIVSPETGLINDSRLDDVSDALADEQDQLRALRRSLSRA